MWLRHLMRQINLPDPAMVCGLVCPGICQKEPVGRQGIGNENGGE